MPEFLLYAQVIIDGAADFVLALVLALLRWLVGLGGTGGAPRL